MGEHRTLIIQVLLALHAYTDADCIVLCPDSVRYLRLSNLCSSYHLADLDGSDDDRIVDIVNRYAKSAPDLVFVPSDCAATRLAHRVRGRLYARIARIPDTAMLDLFDNKWHFHRYCMERGLNVPPTMRVASKEELDFSQASRELGLPFIVKPIDEHGATGVRLVSSEQDFQERILRDETYRFAPLLAQRYVRGIDMGLNLLSIRGKVQMLAIQRRDYPQNEEAKIRFLNNEYLMKAAVVICEGAGYDGVMNVDARIEEQTGIVYLFEANPRYWVSLSASVWCGLNFLAENLQRSEPSEEVRLLTSGTADTFYHPLLRPALWPYVLFRGGQSGRLSRLMSRDICSLVSQVRIALVHRFRKNLPPGVSAPAHRVWTT